MSRFFVDYVSGLLKVIDKIYLTSSTENKQRIISSIFPEKLIYENNKYRTAKLNLAVLNLCSNNKRFKGEQKQQHTIFDMLSCKVIPTGFEPVAYCLEGSCSIQLSYGTFCKRIFSGHKNTKNS